MRHFLLLTMLFSGLCYSQHNSYHLRHYYNSKGLDSRSIGIIVQDKKGYIWVSSINGLYKYDGYSFKNYFDLMHESLKKDFSFIHYMTVTKNGRLLFDCKGGLFYFNDTTESIQRIPIEKIGNIFYIAEDSQENLWIADNYKNILVYNINTRKSKRINLSCTLPDSLKHQMSGWQVIGGNRLCYTFSHNNGLILYMASMDSVLKGNFNAKKYSFNFKNPDTYGRIVRYYEDRSGNVFLTCSHSGVYQYKEKEDTIIKCYSFDKRMIYEGVYDFVFDKNDNFFIGTGNGLYKLNMSSKKLERLSCNSDNPFSAKNDKISSLLIDNDSLLWIATNENLNSLNLKANPIKYFSPIKFKNDYITCESINAFYKDNDSIVWLGNQEGLFRINENTNVCTDYFENIKYSETFAINPLSCNKFGNHIMIGTNCLVFLDSQNKSFSYANSAGKDTTSIAGWAIWSIYRAPSSGDYWIATVGGLSKILSFPDFKKESQKPYQVYPVCKNYKHSKINSNSLVNNNVWCVLEDHNGMMWIGTIDGLSVFNPFKNQFKNYNISLDNSGLNNSVIKCIYESRDSTIWIGTEGGGLNRFDRKTERFKYYTTKEGISSDIVRGVLEDNSGLIWITTTKGISCLNPKNDSIRGYGLSDGFISDEFNVGVSYIDKNGRIYVGGSKGLCSFVPEEIKINTKPPIVYISGLHIFNHSISAGQIIEGRTILEKTMLYTQRLVLPYRFKVLSFEFSVLHFIDPEKNRIKYKLEGFDRNWIESAPGELRAHYMNLPPATYHLKVIACNCDGVWNEIGDTLELVILPPFWLTWWFRLLILFFISTIVYLYIRYRTFQLKRRNIFLESEVKERTKEIAVQNEELKLLNATKDKFFSIIAHDLKNPFNSILGLSELLQVEFDNKSDQEKKEMIDFILSASRSAFGLLENLLEWSRSQLNKIQFTPQSFSLYQIVTNINSLLMLNLKNKNITLVNNIEQKIAVFADKNMFTTVLRNLITNAIKFTPDGGQIVLSSKKTDNLIEISVQDTGVGMDDKTIAKLFRIDNSHTTTGTSGETGTGLGLIICKEFIEKNDGSISVISQLGNGSKFIISIPSAPDIELTDEIPLKDSVIKSDPECMESSINENYSEKKTIVIVDDEASVRATISKVLSASYNIIEAENGKLGIDKAFTVIPDLIISDLNMPEQDGIQLCEILKTDIRTSHIPIILLTANDSDISRIKGYENGADEYIVKPFKSDILKVRIRKLIESRQILREKFTHQVIILPHEITVNTTDEKFITKAINSINNNIADINFSLEIMSKEVGVSKSTLNTKLKALTDLSTNEFIKSIRLKRAAELLIESKYSVSEIAFRVGFNTPSYFTQCFKEMYSILPSEYQTSNK